MLMYSTTSAATGLPWSSNGVNFHPRTSACSCYEYFRQFAAAVGGFCVYDVAFGGHDQNEFKLMGSRCLCPQGERCDDEA